MKDMRIYNYFAALLLMASVTVSCSKGTAVDETQPQNPDKPVAILPNINFGKAATKVMMNNDDLHYNGNKIQVYDILTGFEGQITGFTNGGTYIDEEITYDNTKSQTIWQYPTGKLYPWTETGTHQFFGWLTYDAKSSLSATSLGISPTRTGTTLTVPDITFTAGTAGTSQFDFMYSNMVTRDAASKNYNTVPLNFKHLFTALSLQVTSISSVKVKVTSLKLNNLKNKNSATIPFTSDSQATLGTASVDGSFLPAFSEFELSTNQFYDVLKKEAVTEGTRNFYMLWPLTASDVADIEVEVEYSMYIDNVCEPQDSYKKNLGEMAWEAGKKNHYTITFTDKRIELTTLVLPWDYNVYDVDFGSGNIVAPQALKFEDDDRNHVVKDGDQYTIADGEPLKGTFRIQAPVGGTWFIGLEGDTGYFTVSPESGIIDPANDLVTIYVTPNTTLARPEDKKVHFTFMVRASGRDINANSELNYDDVVVRLAKD